MVGICCNILVHPELGRIECLTLHSYPIFVVELGFHGVPCQLGKRGSAAISDEFLIHSRCCAFKGV